MSWWRPVTGARASAARHRATSLRERYLAVSGGKPELAAGAGPGQEPEKELAIDRCSGDRNRAPALSEQPLGVAIADRVAKRRGQVRVEAAQRDDMGNPAGVGSPDHVLMVNHDLCHRAIARDEHKRVDIAQRGAKSLRVDIVGGPRADARWPPPGQQPATGQRDDLVLSLSGHQPHDLAANPSAGTGHRDAQHALPPAGGQGLDGCMRPECPVRTQQQRWPQRPRGGAERLHARQAPTGANYRASPRSRRDFALPADYLAVWAGGCHRQLEYRSARSGGSQQHHAEQWGAYPAGSSSRLARNHERSGGLRGGRHGDGLGYSAVSIDDRSLQRRDRGSAGGRGWP